MTVGFAGAERVATGAEGAEVVFFESNALTVTFSCVLNGTEPAGSVTVGVLDVTLRDDPKTLLAYGRRDRGRSTDAFPIAPAPRSDPRS